MKNTPINTNNCSNNINLFSSARNAFKFLLQKLNETGNRSILLPAYIGYTDREGSGVFDPVSSLRLMYDFYEVDEKLSVNVNHLENKLRKKEVDMLLIIHYFGFCQNNMSEIKRLCIKYDVLLIEDCAHTPQSTTSHGKLGDIGDFSFFSIHKYYPTIDGGILKVNNDDFSYLTDKLTASLELPHAETLQTLISSNVEEIKERRRRNYLYLDKFIGEIPGIKKLFNDLPEGVSPHNYPLIVENDLRELLYFDLIKNGVPAIALYYRMIELINEGCFEKSLALSSSILSLPIRQDINLDDLEYIIDNLKNYFKVDL